MNEEEENGMRRLLKAALPPAGKVELRQDLWPAMLRRIEPRPHAPPWVDWVLAGGVAVFAAIFPAAMPVLLYYL